MRIYIRIKSSREREKENENCIKTRGKLFYNLETRNELVFIVSAAFIDSLMGVS